MSLRHLKGWIIAHHILQKRIYEKNPQEKLQKNDKKTLPCFCEYLVNTAVFLLQNYNNGYLFTQKRKAGKPFKKAILRDLCINLHKILHVLSSRH
jgi:hypothetical protein